MWVDRKYKELQIQGLKVSSLSEVANVKYEYLLIAVEHLAFAREIREELISCGIPKECILWNGIKITEFLD